MGGNHPQFFLYLFTYIQSLYKFLDRRFRNGLIGTGQRFQRFIGMRIGLAAQNGLDSLGHHAPAIVQVTVDGRFVQQQLTQTLQRTLYGEGKLWF